MSSAIHLSVNNPAFSAPHGALSPTMEGRRNGRPVPRVLRFANICKQVIFCPTIGAFAAAVDPLQKMSKFLF